jgi:hypothetical protein
MEDWFAEGALSQEEFDLLVRLTARYVGWDVDQFDHWELPTPNGPWWVDFGCRKMEDVYGEDAYRVMWPIAEPGEPAWTVWRQDDNGVKVEVARYDREDVAKARVAQLEWYPHKQLYWITPPA